MSEVVHIFRKMDAAIIEVLQKRRMYTEALTKQSNSPTELYPMETAKTSAVKSPDVKVEADEIKVSLPGFDPSSTNVQQYYHRANKAHKRPSTSECDEGATGLKRPNLQSKQRERRPPSPIDLFEDECVFCHSFRTSQELHGPMVLYLKGRLVTADEGNNASIIFVHKKCMEWAPRVWYNGETIMNLEKEIKRASKLKCSRCGLKGAALGCYYKPCQETFHVPCAVQIAADCRWDTENVYVLCPKHVSERLPCDDNNSVRKEGDNSASLPESLCSDKMDSVQTDHQREDRQADQLNTARSNVVNEWVLLGLGLSTVEKDSLQEFASLVNATVAEKWATSVTHVIVGKSDDRAWSRSYEALMAMLLGKWVVIIEWIEDNLMKLCQVPEISYEVEFSPDSRRLIDGPKKGRIQIAEGASKLFAGLYFFLSAYVISNKRENLRDLIAAAGGNILQRDTLHLFHENASTSSVKLYFVYNGGAPEEFTMSSLLDLRKEVEEGTEFAAWGAQLINHLRVFDAIAGYDAQILNHKEQSP